MALNVTIARGGTSRAVFASLLDVPIPTAELCRSLIGAPDPLAVDGLGGGVSSNSKVMFVGPSDEPGVHLESWFAQVTPDSLEVDFSGNCGNITSAISAYALHVRLLRLDGERAVVRVRNRNTGALLELAHPLHRGQLPASGDFALDGVAGTGARIDVRFLAPGGEKTGSIFPCGRITTIDGVTATCIDVTNPIVIVRASDVAADSSFQRLMRLRRAAGEAMGLDFSPAVPRVALVAPRTDGGLDVTMTTVGDFHHALPATGILALGAAVALGGTVIELPPSAGATLHHPKGPQRCPQR